MTTDRDYTKIPKTKLDSPVITLLRGMVLSENGEALGPYAYTTAPFKLYHSYADFVPKDFNAKRNLKRLGLLRQAYDDDRVHRVMLTDNKNNITELETFDTRPTHFGFSALAPRRTAFSIYPNWHTFKHSENATVRKQLNKANDANVFVSKLLHDLKHPILDDFSNMDIDYFTLPPDKDIDESLYATNQVWDELVSEINTFATKFGSTNKSFVNPVVLDINQVISISEQVTKAYINYMQSGRGNILQTVQSILGQYADLAEPLIENMHATVQELSEDDIDNITARFSRLLRRAISDQSKDELVQKFEYDKKLAYIRSAIANKSELGQVAFDYLYGISSKFAHADPDNIKALNEAGAKPGSNIFLISTPEGALRSPELIKNTGSSAQVDYPMEYVTQYMDVYKVLPDAVQRCQNYWTDRIANPKKPAYEIWLDHFNLKKEELSDERYKNIFKHVHNSYNDMLKRNNIVNSIKELGQ